MVVPRRLQLVCLLPALGSEGDAAGAGRSAASSAGHQPVLGVAVPAAGERRQGAEEGKTGPGC